MRFVSLPETHQTLEHARENIAVCAKFANGRRRPVLVDIRSLTAIDGDARRYYAGDEAAQVESAIALLVGSPVSRMVGNFFLSINRPQVPVRLFTIEGEALAWLRGFIDEKEEGR
ncbi:MAG: STAS/SEC14 domain-containing protein [Deltaproteobacteria bacterium]|nr:STAS/SEC14 domain-containing protein [Deltaproteobacteria bacterium]